MFDYAVYDRGAMTLQALRNRVGGRDFFTIARRWVHGNRDGVGGIAFDTDEEALDLANNTKYGLAAYVWTNDLKRGHNFAQSVEAGMVWLNSHNVRDLRSPFGGVKSSGLGHEGGYRSIDFYTDQQAVHITLDEVHTPKFGAFDAETLGQ